MIDPRRANQVFELPVTSFTQNVLKPKKEIIAPISNFLQSGDRTCGVSAMSSAVFTCLIIIWLLKLFHKKISIRKV